MSNDNPIGFWSGVVPEFCYDLISRVPPGIFLIVVLFFEFEIIHISDIKGNDKLGTFFILFIFTAGYPLGIFLSVLGENVSRFYLFCVWRKQCSQDKNFQLLKQFCKKEKLTSIDNKEIKQLGVKEFKFIYRRLHDYLKREDNKQARTLLPKISAENSLCNNTLAVLIVWIIIHLIHSIYQYITNNAPIQEGCFIIIVISLAIALLWIGKERYDRLISGHFSFLNLLYREDGQIHKEIEG